MRMESMTEVWRWVDQMHTEPDLADFSLADLGQLHRALRAATVDVEAALAPKIVDGAGRGKTYVELAVAAGYGSTTTITKIIKEQGAGRGRGSNQPPTRRRRA